MTEPSDRDLSPAERANDIPRILRALRQAVREALLDHKRAGNPVAIWRDGRVVWIPPEEIPEWGRRGGLTMSRPMPNERRVPPAPAFADLPQKRLRAARGGNELVEITAALEVVTPILGGGVRTRALDDVDIIRPATVRGHLRSWWRALHGHEHESSKELHAAEAALFGHAAGDAGGRSAVEIRVRVERVGDPDETDVHPTNTEGAYALWPARAEKERGRIKTPAAPRRKPGTRFRLFLRAPRDREEDLREVVRAWILFGGYGGRTRRGLGSLGVYEDDAKWLPKDASRESIESAFGRDVLAPVDRPPLTIPWLAGAALHVGSGNQKATAAWTIALGWLQQFRQGTEGEEGERAREPGAGNRPSISNWPEADKIRHLTGKTQDHEPRHDSTPAWPRAGFGLPIVGRFQNQGRNGGRYDEPGPYELCWRSADGSEHDRLGSPLIVKALPLAGGHFVPCALWLARAHPEGEVVLRNLERSSAPFDRVLGPGDEARFSALAGKTSLRDAFLDWLLATHETKEEAR